MINILYLVSTLEKVGPTKQLYYIVKYLDREKFRPFILTLSPEPKNTMWPVFGELNVTLASLNLSRLQGLFLAQKQVNKFINENDIEIIHSHFIRADSIAVKTDVKSVVTIRNNTEFAYKVGYGSVLGSYLTRKHLNIFKRADKAIACSKGIFESLLHQKTMMLQNISNSVDVDTISLMPVENKTGIRSNLQLPPDHTVFITVDSSIPGKNVELTIQSFTRTQKSKQLLVIAGKSKLEQKYSAVFDIKFIGNVGNFSDYLVGATFFVSASLSEGMPNAVLEAMANGLPVILSDIPPHREIVEGTVLEKYLFSPENGEQLQARMEDILKDDYALLSRASRTIIEKRFSAKMMSRQYQKVYMELIAKQ